MAENIQKKAGTISNYQNDRGGGVLIDHPVIAVVKDNIDPTHSGRIRVYVANYGGINPEDEKSWVTVSYMSPYYGIASYNNDPLDGPDKSGNGNFIKNPHSYGFWASAPDIGTEVICIFINGNPSQGYYIGSAPTPGAHHMVPAIAAGDIVVPNTPEASSYGGANRLPVSEVNIASSDALNSGKVYTLPKPIHSYQSSRLFAQGIIRDNIRGVISSSSQRETPSRVFGISTPGGTIYEGGHTTKTVKSAIDSDKDKNLKTIGRTGGHSIVLDDGTIDGKDQLVRIRTSAGHTIMMNDSGQNIFIIHSNGQSWIELGKEGTVDIFSTNSFNVRTQGDLNLHADRDVNIHAKRNLKMYGENINIEADKNMTERVGKNFSNHTLGNYSVKVQGTMSLQSFGDSSLLSKGINYINGTKIHLNTGFGPEAVPVSIIPKIAHVDTAFSENVGWVNPSPEGPTTSIITRLTTHQPWVGGNKGVDIKGGPPITSYTPPTANVQKVNASVPSTPSKPVNNSTVATTPAASPVNVPGSKPIITPSTAVTAIAQQAASNTVLSESEKISAGIMPGSAGATLSQLCGRGQVLKPGTEQFITDLRGKFIPERLDEAVSTALTTGKSGVKTVNGLVKNTGAQIGSITNSLQEATTDLVKKGILSGKELSTDITGIIMAAATFGTKSVENLLSGAPVQNLKRLQDTISGGNFASGIADKVQGALSGVSEGIGSLVKSLGRGISALTTQLKNTAKAAYDIVEKSFQKLKKGQPNSLNGQEFKQTVTEIEKQFNKLSAAEKELLSAEAALIAAKSELRGSSSPDNLAAVQQAEAELNVAKQNFAKAGNAIINGAENVVAQTTGATTTTNALNDAISKLPGSGLNAIPGGLGAFSGQVVEQASNIVKNVKDIANKVENGISGKGMFDASKLSGNLVSNLSSAISGLKSNLSGANTSSISGQLDSLANNGMPQIKGLLSTVGNSGMVKAAILAEKTYNNSSIKSKSGELLEDGRIPPPVFEEVPSVLDPDKYLQAQSAALDEVKRLRAEVENQKTKMSTVFAELQQAGETNSNAGISRLAAEGKKLQDLEQQLQQAQVNYERVVSQ